MNRRRTARVIAWAAAAAALAHGLCLWWDAASAAAPARVARAATGLCLVMLGPGALAALAFTRRPRLGALAFFSRAWAWNAGLWIAALTALRAVGVATDAWTAWGVAAALTAAGAALLLRRRAWPEVVWPAGGWTLAAAAAACPLILLLTSRPMVVDETNYWPLETEWRLFQLGARSHSPGAQFRVARSSEWRKLDERRYEITRWPAALTIENRGAKPALYALRLAVEAHVEGVLSVWAGGRRVWRRYLPPRMIRQIHPRNYPPPNVLLAADLRLPPGRTRVVFRLIPDSPGSPRRVVVTDLSGLDRRRLRSLFRRYAVVAPVGDIQSNLNLARNLNDHVWLFTYSYNGDCFDRGGYTITNLPFPYYVDNLALLLLGDSPMSLDALFLALTAAMLATLVALAGAWGRPNQERCVWLAFAAMLCYGTVMRLHVEALYMHTLLTFCGLLAAYHFLRDERGPFAAYAGFLLLSKGGLPLLGVLLAAAWVAAPAPRRRAVGYGLGALAAAALGLLAFNTAAQLHPALAAWAAEAKSNEYAGRFTLLLSAPREGWDRLLPLLDAGSKLTLLALAVSCLLPAQLAWARDRRAWWLLLAGLAFHLLVCASDPWVMNPRVIQYPLNYVTPAAVLWACAGLRGLALRPRPRRPLRFALGQAAVCAGCLLWCMAAAEGHYGPWPAPAHEAMHATALADYLVRRGVMRLRQGEYAAALRDARRAELTCEGRLMKQDLPRVLARARALETHALFLLGRRAEALEAARRAAAQPEARDALRWLARRLAQDGRRGDAAALERLLRSLPSQDSSP